MSPSPGTTPDRWLAVEVARLPDPESAALVADELLALPRRGPIHGVEEREDRLVVYLPPPEDADPSALMDEIAERLADLVDPALEISFRWQPHEAWQETWRRGLRPRRVTPRLVVSPSWEEPELEPGESLVAVDPGMAFGTAEHATTRGCLRLLDRFVEPGQRLADVGAGSGILSIAAIRLGADEVVALEMDPTACEVARENARRNGVEDRIQVRRTAATPDFLPDEPPFHGVVANIESGVLTTLLPGFRAGLAEGGWLILSGILEHEAAEMRQRVEDEGFRLAREDREDGWWNGAFVTPPAEGVGEVPGEPAAPRREGAPTGPAPGSNRAPGPSPGS